MAHAAFELEAPPRYDLRLGLFDHGWIGLPPHRWDADSATWTTPLRLGERVCRAEVSQPRAGRALRVALHGERRPGARAVELARRALRHMLRFDDDLAPLHAMCGAEPRLAWASRRGAGRLLRSQSVFEDLMKLLFTTNTSWAGTVAMTAKLVDACGSVGPDVRAFPTPEQCLRPAAFYRDTVRAGYRAEAARELAAAFVDGSVDDATFIAERSTEALRERLLALRGFGPYAAGQAMRLLGHYNELALDSWCRARLAELDGRKQPPSDRTIQRRYAKYRPYEGLVLWLDLTADTLADEFE